jgi:hypothetical protein
MLDDFRKSVQLILHERLTSPLSGAFFISWIVWNWRAVYYVFFSEASLPIAQRLVYINSNFVDLGHNLLYPVLSTIFLVGVYPVFTTGALWVWLKFRTWQNRIKNKIERQTLLTAEQSFAVRLESTKARADFDNLMKSKDDEIASLRVLLSSSSKNLKVTDSMAPKVDESDRSGWRDEFLLLLDDTRVRASLDRIIAEIQGIFTPHLENSGHIPYSILQAHGIIEKVSDTGQGRFKITPKGDEFLRLYFSTVP